MAKTWTRSEPLIEGHIKDVSIGVIQDHLQSFREFLGPGRSGIYVLRKDEDVYYIGLASSLRGRLPAHITNGHKGKWNRFDLYIVRKSKVKYLRELETLLIRGARPTADQNEPNFIKSRNLTKEFKHALEKNIAGLFSVK
jgi:hypothetical protein